MVIKYVARQYNKIQNRSSPSMRGLDMNNFNFSSTLIEIVDCPIINMFIANVVHYIVKCNTNATNKPKE